MQALKTSQRLAIAIAACVLAVLFAAMMPGQAHAKSTVTFKVTGEMDYDEANAFFEKLNKLRADKGLAKLSLDKKLTKAAEQRAAEISVFYSHTRPNGKKCATVSKYLNGENIQWSMNDADMAYTSWKNSPPHYANMTRAKFRTAGVACFERDGVTVWVNLFGTKSTGKVKKSGVKKTTRKVTLAKKYLTKKAVSIGPDVVESDSTTKAVVYFSPKNADKPGTLPASMFTFKSSNPYVLKVSKSGVMSAGDEGSAKVTLTAKCKKSCKKSQAVQVSDDFSWGYGEADD